MNGSRQYKFISHSLQVLAWQCSTWWFRNLFPSIWWLHYSSKPQCLVSGQQAEEAWVWDGTGGVPWPRTGNGRPHFYLCTCIHWPEPILKTTSNTSGSSCVCPGIKRNVYQPLPYSSIAPSPHAFLKEPSVLFDKDTPSLLIKRILVHFLCENTKQTWSLSSL